MRYFLERIAVDENGCWIWQRSLDKAGYGQTGRGPRAHRAIFQLIWGELPDDIEVDHVYAAGCRSRACVNPVHLESVTRAENNRRMWENRPRVKSCAYGHPYAGENAMPNGKTGRILCRTCRGYNSHIANLKIASENPSVPTRNRMVFGQQQFLAIARAKAMEWLDSIADDPRYRTEPLPSPDEFPDLQLLHRYAAAKGPYE